MGAQNNGEQRFLTNAVTPHDQCDQGVAQHIAQWWFNSGIEPVVSPGRPLRKSDYQSWHDSFPQFNDSHDLTAGENDTKHI